MKDRGLFLVAWFLTLKTLVVLASPASGQDWRTVGTWDGEPGTFETEVLTIRGESWRLVWETAAAEMIPVFSVLVFCVPSDDEVDSVAGLSAGADSAIVAAGAGAFRLEISSTLPWHLRVQEARPFPGGISPAANPRSKSGGGASPTRCEFPCASLLPGSMMGVNRLLP